MELPLPVRIRIEGREPLRGRLRDAALLGLAVQDADGGRPGQQCAVEFEGYPGVSEPFELRCRVVHRETGEKTLGLQVDRNATPEEALRSYRQLVAHYLHHRPLLGDQPRGFSEGSCESCGWLGRVGARKPSCPLCGGRVVATRGGDAPAAE